MSEYLTCLGGKADGRLHECRHQPHHGEKFSLYLPILFPEVLPRDIGAAWGNEEAVETAMYRCVKFTSDGREFYLLIADEQPDWMVLPLLMQGYQKTSTKMPTFLKADRGYEIDVLRAVQDVTISVGKACELLCDYIATGTKGALPGEPSETKPAKHSHGGGPMTLGEVMEAEELPASECSTCNDTGEVDESLGGSPRSNRHAPCPDCRPREGTK